MNGNWLDDPVPSRLNRFHAGKTLRVGIAQVQTPFPWYDNRLAWGKFHIISGDCGTQVGDCQSVFALWQSRGTERIPYVVVGN